MKHPVEVLESGWEDLEEGDTIRIHCNHPLCREKTDALTITRLSNGVIYNCYRCGTSGALFKGRSPNAARIYISQLRNNRHSIKASVGCDSSVILPRDFICLKYAEKLPPQALAWLFKYELTLNDAETYNIGYSKKLERVVIPIYNSDCKLIAWQGRDIYYAQNKKLYESGIVKKKPLKYYTEYNSQANDNKKLFYKIMQKESKVLVLVEDILSAIKVANKSKYSVVALLNSTLYNKLIETLNLHSYEKVYIWLDPDKRIESLQGSLRWNRLGVITKHIWTNYDPKEIPYAKLMSCFIMN